MFFFFILVQLLTAKDYIGIVQILIPTSTNLCCLYVFCHFGNKVTQNFLNITDDIYATSWYEFPLEMQKNFPMIIALSQKSIYLRGFGDSRCTLEVFMKVLNSKDICTNFETSMSLKKVWSIHFHFSFQIMKAAFSYFMVLREFDF